MTGRDAILALNIVLIIILIGLSIAIYAGSNINNVIVIVLTVVMVALSTYLIFTSPNHRVRNVFDNGLAFDAKKDELMKIDDINKNDEENNPLI